MDDPNLALMGLLRRIEQQNDEILALLRRAPRGGGAAAGRAEQVEPQRRYNAVGFWEMWGGAGTGWIRDWDNTTPPPAGGR
jgi:hypothetical protein